MLKSFLKSLFSIFLFRKVFPELNRDSKSDLLNMTKDAAKEVLSNQGEN